MLKIALIWLMSFAGAATVCGQSASANYIIKAQVIPDSAKVRGQMELQYDNRSNNALDELVFQIDMNATQAGGMMERRLLMLEDSSVYRMDRAARGYCRINSILYRGEPIPPEYIVLDNSVLKLKLPQVIGPKEGAFLVVDFESQVSTRNDHKNVSKYLSFIGWYPRLCAYRDGTWHYRQFLGWSPMPGEFADYRVEIEIDTAYSVAHTGRLLNDKEHYGFVARPDSPVVLVDFVNTVSRDALGGDFKRSFDSPTKKYIIEAEQETSFGFIVTDSLIRDRVYTDGTLIDVCYKESSRKRFADSVAYYCRELLNRFKSYPGSFPYRTLTVVAGDTTDLQSPSASLLVIPRKTKNRQAIFSALAVHIVSHLLPQALPGSNPADWAFPDGLAYYTAASVLGREDNYEGLIKYEDILKNSVAYHLYRRDCKFLDPYKKTVVIEDSLLGMDMHRLAGYAESRFRRYPSELYMLRFLVGDEVLNEAIAAFSDSGRFDFGNQRDFEQLVQTQWPDNLNWFFSLKDRDGSAYDCAITDVKVGQEQNRWALVYKVENFGSFLMPVEIGFLSAAADTIYDTLGLVDFAEEQTAWWFKASLEVRPVAMVLDPNHYLPDTNRYNNYWFDMPVRYKYQDPKSLFIGYRKF